MIESWEAVLGVKQHGWKSVRMVGSQAAPINATNFPEFWLKDCMQRWESARNYDNGLEFACMV